MDEAGEDQKPLENPDDHGLDKSIDDLIKRTTAIVKQQIDRLEVKSKTGTLNSSQFKGLTDSLRTLASLRKSNWEEREQKKKTGEDPQDALKEELASMSKEELFSFTLPLLEQLGIDASRLCFKVAKESKKEEVKNEAEISEI